MGWNEAWGVLGCALAGAGIGVGIVLTVGALAAPYGAAIWAVTVIEGTTALTSAGCTALAVAGATSAAAGAHFGNARANKPITPTRKGVISVTYIVPSSSKMFGLFLSQQSCQMAASGRTCSDEHQKTQTRAHTTNNSRPELC